MDFPGPWSCPDFLQIPNDLSFLLDLLLWQTILKQFNRQNIG